MMLAQIRDNVAFSLAALIVLLIFAAFHFAKIRRRIKEQRQRQAATGASIAPVQHAPAAEIIPPNQRLPLAAQLHQLESALAGFAANTAHPRELRETAEFGRASALLADNAVPLETVMQYAHGANWVLSCAALVALAERNDSAGVA